jgi:hypothetical protein
VIFLSNAGRKWIYNGLQLEGLIVCLRRQIGSSEDQISLNYQLVRCGGFGSNKMVWFKKKEEASIQAWKAVFKKYLNLISYIVKLS